MFPTVCVFDIRAGPNLIIVLAPDSTCHDDIPQTEILHVQTACLLKETLPEFINDHFGMGVPRRLVKLTVVEEVFKPDLLETTIISALIRLIFLAINEKTVYPFPPVLMRIAHRKLLEVEKHPEHMTSDTRQEIE